MFSVRHPIYVSPNRPRRQHSREYTEVAILPMLIVFIQTARGRSISSMFRHLGALGLFFLAILDSSPLPTFGGPDILIAILAATHRNPWYEYAAVTDRKK